jgi:peptidoglycan/LPS O-acetylase OafA/YrhL
MTGSGPDHSPEIDRVKGIAILFVIAVHARIGDQSALHEQLVNRALPILLFVFGLTSELSLRCARAEGRSLKDWYLVRLTRLYLPIWGMAALFWLAVLYTKRPPLPVGGWQAVLTFLGYSPWIASSWFVTLLIQLLLIFPALSWAADRLGPWLLLPLAAVITAYTVYHSLDIVDFGLEKVSRNVQPPGWFYIWIFVPRALWLVVAGLFVARFWGTKLRLSVTFIAVVIGLFGESAVFLVEPEEFISGNLRKLVVMHLWDVPISVAVLGVMGNVPLPGVVARPLEWCGRFWWGIYLGQIVVVAAVQMLRKSPEAGPPWGRVEYGVVLLVAGVALTLTGDAVRKWVLSRIRAAAPSLDEFFARAAAGRD